MNAPRCSVTTTLTALALALATGVLPNAAGAAEGAPAADKSHYHLFNPTPRSLLREMSTDRPDKTESAYTVDAGHFQFEMDVVTFTYDKERSGGVTHKLEAWAIAPVNLKIGLWNRADLQLVLETYNHVRETSGSRRITRRGYGDTTVRFKYNLWGNDGGRTAFAAMPYLKIPTSQDDLGHDSVEGGLILPFAVALPRGFGLGMIAQFDCVRDADDDGHHAEFVQTLALGRDLWGDLGGYVEFYSLLSAERGSDWIATFDLGLTYAVTSDIQLDAGVNIGVTSAADDWQPFLGLSWRF